MEKRSCTCIVFGLLLTAALADHAFSAEFADREPVSLNGTVTKVDWNHPQVHLFMDVKDAAGKVTNWEVEFGSRDRLEEQGWAPLRLGVGSDVNVRGWRSTNGDARAAADSITTSAGIRLSTRPSNRLDSEGAGQLARRVQADVPESPDMLPGTASVLALAGLFGLLSCAAAGVIRASRLTR